MGITFNKRKRARPFMAVELYDIEYHDGRQRTKQLHREDADRLKERDRGVKSVTKARGPAQTKMRQAQSDKGRGAPGSGVLDSAGVDAAAHVDEDLTREANEAKTQAANENTDQSTAEPRTRGRGGRRK